MLLPLLHCALSCSTYTAHVEAHVQGGNWRVEARRAAASKGLHSRTGVVQGRCTTQLVQAYLHRLCAACFTPGALRPSDPCCCWFGSLRVPLDCAKVWTRLSLVVQNSTPAYGTCLAVRTRQAPWMCEVAVAL